MITTDEGATILQAVARYGVAEHLMARELYAPGTVTHGAAQRCEQALGDVHTLVHGLIDRTTWTDSAPGVDLDPAMAAIDSALVEMNIYTTNLLARLRELGVDTDTVPRTYPAIFPGPPPPIPDDFTYLNEYGRPRR
jgi:hypothetical protein